MCALVLTIMGLAEGDDMLGSASGDQTIRVWDMSPDRPEVVATLRGHKGSVKSVQFRPHSRCELVSGARGGDIILWDTRVTQGAVTAVSVKVRRNVASHLALRARLCTRAAAPCVLISNALSFAAPHTKVVLLLAMCQSVLTVRRGDLLSVLWGVETLWLFRVRGSAHVVSVHSVYTAVAADQQRTHAGMQ